jgi:plastocyanin
MDHVIEIRDLQFNPPNGEPVVVAVGDKVKWHNNDGAMHNAVRRDAPTFATRLLGKDETSDPITFDSPTSAEGIEYACGPHPFMKGRLIVMARGSDPAAYTVKAALASHSHAKGKQP